MLQLLEIYFAFSRIDSYMYKKTTFQKFHLTVKTDLVEVDCYLKQVFHLLYDKSVAPAVAIIYFSFLS